MLPMLTVCPLRSDHYQILGDAVKRR